jgi:sulfite reductase alpha subunit-like flavoprotein
MPTLQTDSKTRTATLVGSHRITAETAAEEVRHLVFRTGDSAFQAVVGACIRILAPGQFGAKHHARMYSILDVVPNKDDATEFAICVRRCQYVDEFNGERYDGVASNHLCDLRNGDAVQFVGPVSYPFAVPDDKNTNLLMIGMGTGIAPFRGLIRQIYEKIGGWQGKVRLFFGAKSGLEMLYMNNENSDLSLYYDQPTFKAFQAVSPRPALDAPVALDQAIEQNAAEVWEMMQSPNTHVFISGTAEMWPTVEKALVKIAGSRDAWSMARQKLADADLWTEVLY